MSAKKPSHPRATLAAKIVGTLGYFSVLLQWAWTILILCYPLLVDDNSILLSPKPIHPIHAQAAPLSNSPIMAIVALAVTAFILALTVIVLVKLPKKIGQQGARVTHQTTDAIIPLIVGHKTLPKKKHLKLSYRITLVVKTLLVVIPIIGLFFVPSSVPLDITIIWYVGIFCACWSIFYFGLQQLVGIVAKLPLSKLW